MNSAIERLLTLRISDVMSKNVISVSSCDTMANAARKLVEHSISGVPVLDAQQGCAGMLSAIDFVKHHAGQCSVIGPKGLAIEDQAAQFEDVDVNDDDGCGDESVLRHMTPAVQSIAANQSLMSAARVMCTQHIHRLPVLDQRGQIQGMITALDIVAAFVNAIEE